MNDRIRIAHKREPITAFSEVLQRSTSTPGLVQDVLTSRGQPLETNEQDFMESRFGHDFSQVRVHTDEKAVESARAVNALAYTVGNDVVFGQGQYEPGTSEGKKLLAHELTHVVQQVTASPERASASGLSLSRSSDEQEIAANEVASRISEQASKGQMVSNPISVKRNPGPAILQRFQAGDTGHGGIEKRALTRIGFTPGEANKVYFGNWLRDLSQVPPSLLGVVNILAQGAFRRNVTKEDLGTYIPSEHLDNPEGGKTCEDPLQKDPGKQRGACNKMSSRQEEEHRDEQDHHGEIKNTAKESGLREYIEIGKFHAKRKLTEAITLGRTDGGMEAMGNGLHAIEDYFSHSNFVEVAIWNLFKKGEIAHKQYSDLTRTSLGKNAATIGKSDQIDTSQPAIITGTYASANSGVSALELLITEVQHGQLTEAFIKGVFIKYGIIPEEIVKKALASGEASQLLLDAVGGGILGEAVGAARGGMIGGVVGEVGGGIVGGIAGAEQGATEGWREHSGLSAVWHASTGLVSGAISGASGGALEGEKKGEDVGQKVGGTVGTVIGGLAGLAMGLTIDMLFGLLGAERLSRLFPQVNTEMTEMISLVGTARADQQAKKEGLGPSHSELAKDAPDHQLFTIAVKLAEYVDEEIGKEMIIAWKQEDTEEKAQMPEAFTADRGKTVTDLVDKYVSHPSRDNWWHDLLIAWLEK